MSCLSTSARVIVTNYLLLCSFFFSPDGKMQSFTSRGQQRDCVGRRDTSILLLVPGGVGGGGTLQLWRHPGVLTSRGMSSSALQRLVASSLTQCVLHIPSWCLWAASTHLLSPPACSTSMNFSANQQTTRHSLPQEIWTQPQGQERAPPAWGDGSEVRGTWCSVPSIHISPLATVIPAHGSETRYSHTDIPICMNKI